MLSFDDFVFLRFHCLMSAQCVTFCEKHFAIFHYCWCHDAIMQSIWDIFFVLHVVTGLSRKLQATILGDMSRCCILHFKKSAKCTRVQGPLLFRWFQITPMNAITCTEIFPSVPNAQKAFSEIRSTENKYYGRSVQNLPWFYQSQWLKAGSIRRSYIL